MKKERKLTRRDVSKQCARLYGRAFVASCACIFKQVCAYFIQVIRLDIDATVDE